MHRLNLLFTLGSLNVLLVTAERFSLTTTIVLQPYSFLRLHELVQISFLILATVVLPYFTLHYLSDRFSVLKTTKGTLLGALFIVAIYFYATGNGVHELASFLFNNYCDTEAIGSAECGSMFFNDYYFGDTLYFAGAFMMYMSLVLVERMNPDETFARKDVPVLIVNALIYAFTIFAYAAFDRVLVGAVYALVTMLIIDALFFTARKSYLSLPFTLYCAIAYTVGGISALAVRLVR